MEKIWESKVYVQTVKIIDILKELPEEVEWHQVRLVPVYSYLPGTDLSELIGYRFVAYK
jgi:hypothetical protein